MMGDDGAMALARIAVGLAIVAALAACVTGLFRR